MAEDLPLALKYRPQTFADLVGQRVNAAVLHRMVQAKRVPHGLLFSGPSGVGKTTAARVLAAGLGAADVIEVDAASNGGVDQVRKLLEVARYSTSGSYRVLILDEAHSITRQGFEALLKTLEEPPGNTVFVLVTTEPHKIPETVLSRLIEFQFRAVSDSTVLDRLLYVAQSESLDVETPLLKHLAQKAGGNVRSALMELDRLARSGVSTLDSYLLLVADPDFAPTILLAAQSGNHAEVFSTLDKWLDLFGPLHVTSSLVSCIRDLLVVRAGGALEVTGDAFEVRRSLALTLEPERLLAAIRVLWEVRTRMAAGDPRSMLEMALVMIVEAFTRGREVSRLRAVPTPAPEAPAAPSADERMSLSDIQRFARVQ